MKPRLLLGALALAVLGVAPTAAAQVVPPPPPAPTPPAELQPLLELLAGPGGVVTEPGCAALGTVLGLGAIAIPGLPGTIEQQTGLPLSGLPIALQPELLGIANTLLFVQGSGCGLLPLLAERTYCASDDDLAAAIPRDQLAVPGSPVHPGDLVPQPVPTVGAIVDTFRSLATLGVPGAAEVVAAFNEVGDCELRSRFTNIEPPPIPPTAQLTPPPTAPAAGTIPPSPLPPAATPAFNATPAIPRAPISTPDPIAVAPASAPGLPIAPAELLAAWLQWLAIAALTAFLYRSIAPRRDQPT